MIARSARSSLSIPMLYSSPETTMLAPGILSDEMTDIIRSSVTGLQQTVNPRSLSQRQSMERATSAISCPSSVSFEPAGVVFRIGAPAASSMEERYLWMTGTEIPSFLAAAVWLPVSWTARRASSCLVVTGRPFIVWEFCTRICTHGALSHRIITHLTG